MKTLVATVALAAVIAAPRANNQPNSVYENGQYLGADPDPNVRLELRRDYEHRDF